MAHSIYNLYLLCFNGNDHTKMLCWAQHIQNKKRKQNHIPGFLQYIHMTSKAWGAGVLGKSDAIQ